METAEGLSLAFRDAMSRFASGVTIVTTTDSSGANSGFTASAFSSLSLNPPLILVCLDRKADCFPAFAEATTFGVSILAEPQQDIAMRFATRGADKFSGGGLVPGPTTSIPLVEGALAQLECGMHAQLDGGDHIILVGAVKTATVSDAKPMVHYSRQFGGFGVAEASR
jgi:flavin reductase ActVB